MATSEKMPTVRGSVFTISMSVLTLVTLFKLENASDVCLISATRFNSMYICQTNFFPSCRIRAEVDAVLDSIAHPEFGNAFETEETSDAEMLVGSELGLIQIHVGKLI